ncbi:MAG: hypothetical protein KAT04_07050 [Methylococcales bacterium]|nr:hypothetical protein [Methylococcales bacterium]
MKGHTKEYFHLFLEAKEKYIERDVKDQLGLDCTEYKNIYNKISKILSSPTGIGIDSQHIRQQLVIEERLNPELSIKIKESLDMFQVIRDAVTDKVYDLTNKTLWIQAIRFALLYYSARTIKVNHGLPENYTHIANSLHHLKTIGFNIESIDGYIKADDTELLRLATAIDYRVAKLGKQGLVIFNSIVDKNFSRNEQRFFFYRRRKTIPTIQKPAPPYGYLFNLFCKHTNSIPKIKNKDKTKLLNEIQGLSTHLATILDIDTMSPWDNINVGSENILEKLTEWVLYPELFYIPQISPIHGKKIFPRIFELIDNNSSECLNEIKTTSKVLEKIEDIISQQGAISGELTEDQIFKLCSGITTLEKLKHILKSISKPSSEINKGYSSPFDAHKSNIRETPLIKTKTGYIVANIATYNNAKYRSLLKLSQSHNKKTEQRLGYALEGFIKESLDESNIDYLHNTKYLTPDYIKQATNTNRDKGECDFIIESSEYIYLVEVKKKGLTKESLSGNGLPLLLDTTLSFLKSINQLAIAELILLNEGEIEFTNSDKKIQLNDREIFKLVISFEDMASLQCDNIKSSLLYGLYNTKISVSDNTANDISNKINKTIEEFTLIQAELSKKGEKYRNAPFHDISYLSIPQLLTILDDVNDNEDLSHNIYCSNSVVYSLMDWYASYKVSRESKLLRENKNIFKKSVLIN